MKDSKKYISIAIVMVLSTGITFFTWAAYQRKNTGDTKKVLPLENMEPDVMDTAKLHMLSGVYEQLYLNRNEFLIAGIIDANNGADTTDYLRHEEYVLSRKGISFYFKIGKTETINANGLCLYVDHGMKKIMLSPEKKVIPQSGMTILTEVLKKVKSEGYTLKSQIKGNTEQITLSNPYHLTCKQYAVMFNILNKKPERLYLRLTDFADPENSKRDNVVDFRITNSDTVSNIATYTAQDMVEKVKKIWTLTAKYQDYELINTL